MITLFALLTAAATASFAAPPGPLEPGRKLRPIALLEFEDEADHFLFVGETDHRNHVFEIENGLSSECLVKSDRSENDLNLDVVLEGNLRLFSRAHGALGRPAGTALIYPDRARARLVGRPLDRAHLMALGIEPILRADDPVPAPRARESHEYLPRDGVVFLISSKTHQDFEDALEDTLANLVAKVGPGCRILKDGNRLYAGRKLVVCASAQVLALVAALAAEESVHASAIFEGKWLFFDVPSSSADAARVLKDPSAPVARAFGALLYLARHAADWGAKFGEAEYAGLAFDLHTAVSGLDQILDVLRKQIELDVRVALGLSFDTNYASIVADVHAHPLYQRFIVPLERAYVEVLAGFATIDNPVMRRLVLISATGAKGAALMNLTKSFGVAWADTYFEWQMDHVREMRHATAYRGPNSTEEWTARGSSGGLFENLNLGAELIAPRRRDPLRHKELFNEVERVAFAPGVSLGQIPDHRALKNKIIDFVIQADVLAEHELWRLNDLKNFDRFAGVAINRQDPACRSILRRFWLNQPVSDEELGQVLLPEYLEHVDVREVLTSNRKTLSHADDYNGSLILSDVLRHLLWPPLDVFEQQPNFQRNTYFANVIDVVTTLLEDADSVLHTEAAYLQLIDMAFSLQAENFDSPEMSEKQRRLGEIVQYRLMRPLVLVQRNKACAFLLSPRPFEEAK